MNQNESQARSFPWVQLMLKLESFYRQPIRRGVGDTVDARFESFHALNPHVYDALIVLASHYRALGRTRISMRFLFECLRMNRAIETVGDDFKLNNSFTSRYARMVAEREPNLGALFELRGGEMAA